MVICAIEGEVPFSNQCPLRPIPSNFSLSLSLDIFSTMQLSTNELDPLKKKERKDGSKGWNWNEMRNGEAIK